MRRLFLSIIAIFGLLCSTAFLSPVWAGTLIFGIDKSSYNQNDTIPVDIEIDSLTDQVAGADIYVLYDPEYLQYESTAQGSFFPLVTTNPTAGKIYISAVVENSSQYNGGLGTIATVSFKAIKAGTTSIQFLCDTARSDTSKIVKSDINATNVIMCSTLKTVTFTIGGAPVSAPDAGGGGTAASTTTTTTANTGTVNYSTGTTTYANNTTYAIESLPRSGVYENVVKFALPGMVLALVGVVFRLVFR